MATGADRGGGRSYGGSRRSYGGGGTEERPEAVEEAEDEAMAAGRQQLWRSEPRIQQLLAGNPTIFKARSLSFF